MVRIQYFHCCAQGSVPGQATEIPQEFPQAKQQKKKKKERERETESYFDLVLTLSRDPTEVREGTLCIAGEWAESVLGRWTSKSLRQVCAQCI